MANKRSDYATGKLPTRVAQGSEVIPLYYEVQLDAAPALNDTIEMGPLPAGHVPIDYWHDIDDLDTGTAMVLALGLLNSGKTDLSTAADDGGAVWASALNDAQAGGYKRNSGRVLAKVASTPDTDRAIAFKVTTAAGTFQAGKIRLCVLARAVP